jgi:tRNA nucleotidyltransferase (CCA-adding enzyme)
MKIYLVGGAVRDKLLGLPIKERDFVVVGATINDMLKSGYKQVGKEFPVFLHPKTGEEYALARMERKVKPGYKGFTFDTTSGVSLEEDLIRRDLTINAMAETPEGQLIDPYHGKQDLEQKVLRHVSPAFAEDPVRILRVGRFLARYAHFGFHVAPETNALMRDMVAAGEVKALVAERVWKELERTLSEKDPQKFFEVLAMCDALSTLFPAHEIQGEGLKALTAAAALTGDPVIRFAAFMTTLSDQNELLHYINDLSNRYRIPNAYKELAKLTARYHTLAFQAQTLSASELLSLFSALDIFRREDRFDQFLTTCLAIAQSKNIRFFPDWLKSAAKAVKSYDVQELVAQNLNGSELAEKLKEKRQEKIEQWLESLKPAKPAV